MKKILFLSLVLFLTNINAQDLLDESFEGATFPPTGWATFIGTNGLGTTQNWKHETTFVNTGTKAAYVNYQNVTNGQFAEDWMVTSKIDLTSVSQAELSFYTRKLFAYQASMNNKYYIKISEVSQTQHNTFTDVQIWTDQQLVGNYNIYEKKTVDLSAYIGKQIYVAFVMTNDNGNGWFVDDVKISGQSTENTTNLPYQYGFESEDDWKIENYSTGNVWTIEENNSFYTASEGSKYARYRFSSNLPANTWYISKGINLTKDRAVKIEFDYKTGGLEGVEKLNVAIGKSKTATALTTSLWQNAALTNTTWETAVVEFTPTEDGVYYLGFHANSDQDQMYLFIDNVKLYENVLGTTNTTKNQLTYYPNPIKDKLQLRNTSEINKISIYSMDGKLVLSKIINAKEADLDLIQLKPGQYLGHVELKNGEKKTIKLLKK